MQYDLISRYIKHTQNKLNHCEPRLSTSEISWSYPAKETFTFFLDNVVYLPSLKDCDKIFFKIAIYHGHEQVSHEIYTDKIENEKKTRDSSVKLNKTINTEISIRNLHRCSKLCICLYSVSKKKKESFPVCWISLNLFDYKGYLISGKKGCYLWQTNQNSFLNLCTANVTGSNPNKDFSMLNIEFLKDKTFTQICYPTKEQIKSFIYRTSDNSHDDCFDVSYALENDNSLLESILVKVLL